MISIIVPVYNVEKYLEACVESILSSTYTDFELILVDDGSTDRSGIICDDYQKKDPRVKVIHQPNAGVSEARNSGLRASTGEFITFVDSDDVIHPQMLEILWNAITSDDYDMSMVRNLRIAAAERDYYPTCPLSELGSNEVVVMSQQEYFSSMFPDTYGFFTGPCHKMFCRNLLFSEESNLIEFKSIPAEDVEWLTRVCLRMEKAVFLPLDLYFYVMRTDSLTHAESQNRMNAIIAGRLNTLYLCLNLIPKDKPQYRALSLKDLYEKMKLYSYRAHGTPYEDEVRSSCKNILKNTVKEYWQLPLSTREKLRESVYCWWPWSFRTLINVGERMAKCKAGKNQFHQ